MLFIINFLFCFFLTNKQPFLMVTFNGWLLLLTGFLYILVLKEIASIPSTDEALSNIFNAKFDKLSTYLLVTAVFLIVPISAITCILCMLKMQMYTQQKCIKKSYFSVVSIMITTYLLKTFKSMFVFYTKLAISETYYLLVRLSKHYNHTISYLIPYDSICSFLLHTAVFISLFAAAEMTIAYGSNTSNITIKAFMLKNKALIGVASAFASIYIALLIVVEKCIGVYKISLGTTLSMNFTRFYEALIINSLCMYLYVILATNELMTETE